MKWEWCLENWRLHVATLSTPTRPETHPHFSSRIWWSRTSISLKGLSEAPEKLMNLVTLFLIFMHFSERLLNHKAFLCKRETVFVDWRTQYCDNVNPSQENPKTDPYIYCHLTLKRTGSPWDTDNVICLNVGADYMGVLSLWKFNELYVYYMCTLVFVYYISLQSLFLIPLWVQMMLSKIKLLLFKKLSIVCIFNTLH